MKQGQAAITARRQHVAALWLRGVNTQRIAESLNTSKDTIERDIMAVREEVTRVNADTLEAKAARSVASLRLVQSEAWMLFTRLDDKSTSKIGALNTITNTEATIARIEGTLSGDHVTQQTINITGGAEWQHLRSLILHALTPHPGARRDVVAALLTAQAVEAVTVEATEDRGGGGEDDDKSNLGG